MNRLDRINNVRFKDLKPAIGSYVKDYKLGVVERNVAVNYDVEVCENYWMNEVFISVVLDHIDNLILTYVTVEIGIFY